MGFLSVALSFIGYVLIYGATANHGRFAASPWTGVTHDAYDNLNPELGGPVIKSGSFFTIPVPKNDPTVATPSNPLPKGRHPIGGSGNTIQGTKQPPRPRSGNRYIP